MICYSCGESLPNEATHCYHCGAVMPTQETLEMGVPNAYRRDARDDILPFDDILEPRRKRTSLPLVLAVIGAVLLVGGGIYFATRTKKDDDVRAKLSQLTFVNVTDTAPIIITSPSEAVNAVTMPSSGVTETQPSVALNLPTTASPSAPKPSVASSFSPPSLPLYTGANVQVQVPPIDDTPVVTKAQPAGGETYTVVSGDTLWSLATRFYGRGSQELAEKIAAANNRTIDEGIKVGEVITIPKLDADSPADSARADVKHTVVADDSYWSLATRYYGKATQALVDKIAAANNRSAAANDLKIGEVITIPDAVVSGSAQTPTAEAGNSGQTTYTVEPDDSYWTVSRKFYGEADYSLARLIAEANGRTIDDDLQVGEVIIIPKR